MNRFRNLGFIEYKDRIRVHKSLLNVILHDQFSGECRDTPWFSQSRSAQSGLSATVSLSTNPQLHVGICFRMIAQSRFHIDIPIIVFRN